MNLFTEYWILNQSFALQLFIIRTQWPFTATNILLRILATVHGVGQMLSRDPRTKMVDPEPMGPGPWIAGAKVTQSLLNFQIRRKISISAIQ